LLVLEREADSGAVAYIGKRRRLRRRCLDRKDEQTQASIAWIEKVSRLGRRLLILEREADSGIVAYYEIGK
jgi:hypothetical protein